MLLIRVIRPSCQLPFLTTLLHLWRSLNLWLLGCATRLAKDPRRLANLKTRTHQATKQRLTTAEVAKLSLWGSCALDMGLADGMLDHFLKANRKPA